MKLIAYSKNPPYMFLSIFATLLEGSTSMHGVSPSGILVKVAILNLVVEFSRIMKQSCIYSSCKGIKTTVNKFKLNSCHGVGVTYSGTPRCDARP